MLHMSPYSVLSALYDCGIVGCGKEEGDSVFYAAVLLLILLLLLMFLPLLMTWVVKELRCRRKERGLRKAPSGNRRRKVYGCLHVSVLHHSVSTVY